MNPVPKARSVAFVILAGLAAAMGRAADCNHNEREDAHDVRPGFELAASTLLRGTTAANPRHLLDLNADGIIDILGNKSGSSPFVAFLGRGDGSFQELGLTAVMNAPASSTVVDFTGDGKADILASDYLSNRLYVVTSESAYAQVLDGLQFDGDGSHAIVAGDLDADGDQDVAALSHDAQSVTVFANVAGSTIEPSQPITLGKRPVSLTAVDLDGDGQLDLLSVNKAGFQGIDPPSVAVLRNLGRGRFDGPIHYATEIDPDFAAVGDFDTDGADDVAVVNGYPVQSRVLWNSQRGELAARSEPMLPGQSLDRVYFEDWTGDGDLDMAVINDSKLLLLENDGSGGFGLSAAHAIRSVIYLRLTGDVNGDGAPDLLGTEELGLFALLNRGNGSLLAPQVVRNPEWTGNEIVLTPDLNGDGREDVALADPRGKEVVWAVRDDRDVLLHERALGTVAPVGSLAAADVDSDGDMDLVTNDSTHVLMAWNSGAALFQGLTAVISTPPGLEGIAVIDAEGDLDMDLLLLMPPILRLARNDGQGQFGSLEDLFAAYALPRSADMDGDGDLDLVTIQRDDVVIFRGDATARFPEQGRFAAGVGLVGIEVADVDGQLGPDVFALIGSGVALMRNGGGDLRPPRLVAAGSPTRRVLTMDINADTNPDLLVSTLGVRKLLTYFGGGDGGFSPPHETTPPLFSAYTPLAASQLPDGRTELFLSDGSGGEALFAFPVTITPALSNDCNRNGSPDDCDLRDGVSVDDDRDGIPDECPQSPIFHRGDVDGDGTVAIADAVRILSHLFLGGAESKCREAADADNSARLEVTDAIVILGYLFLGTSPPSPPGPPPSPCGPDSDPSGSSGDFGCLEYEGC